MTTTQPTIKWLRFDNHSDERDFKQFIEEWKCVIVIVNRKGLAKEYKYKMFLPIVSYDWHQYSTDIYKKSEFCTNCDNVWVYSTWYNVEKIVKVVDIKDIQVGIDARYYEQEKSNPNTQEAISDFILNKTKA